MLLMMIILIVKDDHFNKETPFVGMRMLNVSAQPCHMLTADDEHAAFFIHKILFL